MLLAHSVKGTDAQPAQTEEMAVGKKTLLQCVRDGDEAAAAMADGEMEWKTGVEAFTFG